MRFVNLFLHGIIKSNEIIKNVVIEKDTDNKYYISVAVECLDIKNNNKTRDDKKQVFGIDMSMRQFQQLVKSRKSIILNID